MRYPSAIPEILQTPIKEIIRNPILLQHNRFQSLMLDL